MMQSSALLYGLAEATIEPLSRVWG